jgi:hypothetical protein
MEIFMHQVVKEPDRDMCITTMQKEVLDQSETETSP